MDQKVNETPSLKERISSGPHRKKTLWTRLKRKVRGTKLSDYVDNLDELTELINLSSQGGPIYYQCKDKLLGEGGFAKVYEGLAVHSERRTKPVAIKIGQWSDVMKELVEDDEFGEVPLEVSIMKQLPDHPVAIKFYHYQRLDGARYAIVMERPENCKNLYELRGEQGFPFSEEKARKIVKNLTTYLLAMFEKGIAYRDLTYKNIIYDLDKHTIKLVDYGLACFYKRGYPFTKFVGTQSYMPPEFQYLKRYTATDGNAWCLGFVAYFLLTGCSPYPGAPMPLGRNKLRLFPPHIYSVSKSCQDMIQKMLAILPQKRPTFEEILSHPWITGED